MIDDNMKIILILLEKAEQILSIINLPESAIAKYNTLKQLSFDKIGLDYKPLTKRISLTTNSSTITNNKQSYLHSTQTPSANSSVVSDLSTINPHSSSPPLEKMKFLSLKKNMIIEFLFELIEKQKMENVHMYRNQLTKDAKQLHSFYEQIASFKYSSSSETDDYEFDAKIDEVKLNDFINKLDMAYKLFSVSLKKSGEYSSYTNNDFENIIQNYNKKIEDMMQLHSNELAQYEKKYESLKEKYNPALAEELEVLQRREEAIQAMLLPLFEKYSKKKISVYEPNKSIINKEDSLIQIVNFTICLIEQLFKDNKHLIETVTSIEKEKQALVKDLNLPHVTNCIKRNDLLKDIVNNTNDCLNRSEGFELQLNSLISSLTSILNDNPNESNGNINETH